MLGVGRWKEGRRLSQSPRKVTFPQKVWPILLLGPGFPRLRDQSRDEGCKENRKYKQVS